MDPIYVTGHRNPDTDSIVSAMAYAALRNSLGDRNYIPARLGNVSDETQTVLDLFHAQAPTLITNVRTQVRDLNFDTPPTLDHTVTVNRAWVTLNESDISAIPVIHEDGKLFGMLSTGDIATYTMKAVEDPHVVDVPTYNLLSVLEGKIINQVEKTPDCASGEIVIAIPQARESLLFTNPDSIVICGQQPDIIRRAIDLGVKFVIVSQADLGEEFRNIQTKTCIISTPFDAYRAARMIHQAVPIERICQTENLQYFHLADYIDDVKDVVLKSRFRSYSILDEDEKVVGTLARFHLIRPNKKKIVLVDHNEISQSVPGLSQAEILEIIDHHRLADIQTTSPIFFRNEPLGSTATIVASMYQEKGLMPSEKIAGLLCAAIISDTVMFKSPTCTNFDKVIAERLAKIANVSLEDLGNKIFASNASDDKPASELLYSDFKEFHIAGHMLGIGQITCLNSEQMLERKAEFMKEMQSKKDNAGYDFILLMLTDVLLEGTRLLFIGDSDTISQAYNVETKDNTAFLPHVMSRKKQVVPRLSELWG